MLSIEQEIETRNGLFKIGAVVLNEDETWKDNSAAPIGAKDGLMLRFVPKDERRV